LQSINHIHIPRCSGIYIRDHIIPGLKSRDIPYFALNHTKISPQSFENKAFISGHFGLTPLKYRKDLINVCLVRDPVDRFVSNFIYLNRSYKGVHLDSRLEEWMQDKKQHNLQAKSLSKNINEQVYNSLNHETERALQGWCLETGEINIADVKTFIDSIELIETLENHKVFLSKMNDLIYNSYGFNTFSNKNLINNNFRVLPINKLLRSRIEDLNSLDMDVYEYVRSKK